MDLSEESYEEWRDKREKYLSKRAELQQELSARADLTWTQWSWALLFGLFFLSGDGFIWGGWLPSWVMSWVFTICAGVGLAGIAGMFGSVADEQLLSRRTEIDYLALTNWRGTAFRSFLVFWVILVFLNQDFFFW